MRKHFASLLASCKNVSLIALTSFKVPNVFDDHIDLGLSCSGLGGRSVTPGNGDPGHVARDVDAVFEQLCALLPDADVVEIQV